MLNPNGSGTSPRYLRSKGQHGQDLIEYALMAGFVTVAAASIMPGVAASIKNIMGRIESEMCGEKQIKAAIAIDDDYVMIRIISAVLAVMFLGFIVLRRKKNVE